MYDMRSRSTFPVSTLHHKSSVCSLKLIHNDTYLIAGDFSGKVSIADWDIIMTNMKPTKALQLCFNDRKDDQNKLLCLFHLLWQVGIE